MTDRRIIAFYSLFLLLLGVFLAKPLWAAQSYTVAVGSGTKIYEHSVCRYVLNSSAAATIFISTNTSAEWTSFYSNTIPGVTWDQCCAQDFYRPSTTCVAVGNGYYAAQYAEVRSACTNGAANATSVTYSGPGGGANNCPIGSVTCNATYYRNTASSCALCSNGRYSANGNTHSANTCAGACTNTVAGAASVSYSGPGSSATSCPISSVTCTADYRRPTATTCTACTTGQYNPNGTTSATCSNCTNKPANTVSVTYSGTGGGTNNCPISSVTCSTDYYRNTVTSCSACAVGTYAPSGNTAGSCTACTNKPANSTYTTKGGGSNNCGWTCNAGYIQSGNSCVAAVTCPALIRGPSQCSFNASSQGDTTGYCGSGYRTCECFATCKSDGNWEVYGDICQPDTFLCP